jgi:hypothetical protein
MTAIQPDGQSDAMLAFGILGRQLDGTHYSVLTDSSTDSAGMDCLQKLTQPMAFISSLFLPAI